MNIHDVGKVEYPTTCWLTAIFQRQRELMEKYHPIEKANGLLQTEMFPLNLHDRFCQQRIKDFCWRVTEEIAEASECFKELDFYTEDWATSDKLDHYREELMDALHFLTELSILIGLGPEDVCPIENGKPTARLHNLLEHVHVGVATVEDLFIGAFETIMELGIAANCLKNKPWKQTHQLTDEIYFKAQIIRVWKKFFKLLFDIEFTPEMVYDMYIRKSEVNKFRQRSNY
mgnify:CR=1 FL=1